MIILYTKEGCPWCDDVRGLLKQEHIEFEERECRSNPEYFNELVQKSGQTLTPTLDVDGEILADSDVEQVRKFLHQKGILSE